MPRQKTDFLFNPFSGISAADVKHIIVARFEIDSLAGDIARGASFAVEFLGRKGRGKTTHLRWLRDNLNYPLYELSPQFDKQKLFADTSDVLFIDSIHHLSFQERVQLLRSKRVLVFTTHWTRKLECVLAGTELKTIRFKGISESILNEIITKRLQLASGGDQDVTAEISKFELKKLIAKSGDNYREIINGLYDKYQ